MIARTGSKGFFAAHYEWLALGLGVIVLGVGIFFYVSALGEDPDEAAMAESRRLDQMKPKDSGVTPVDMSGLQAASALIRKPVLVPEIPNEGAESFLASERRIICKKCGKAAPASAKACPILKANGEPCGGLFEEAKKVVLDADGDGLPDEWEKKYGLNVNDASDANADLDGDEFTNLEEYVAKTDPKDRMDHPDYLDSLKIVLPLKSTSMPFVFRKANKIPSGWRCEFFDPSRKDDYGRKGMTLTAVIGEEIADTGFVLKSHVEKTAREAIKGGEGLTKEIDASEVVVERKSDGKQITLVVQRGKAVKLAPVDVQATLRYERGAVKTIEAVPGEKIVLSGTEYKVTEIKASGKGAKVVVENVRTGRSRTLEALEP